MKHGKRVPSHPPEHARPDTGDPGIIADLQDQAEWSSYAQNIPRLGDERREAIRLARIRRMGTRIRDGSDLSPDWWIGAKIALAFGVVVLLVIWAVRALFG
jgi:hypothetical protein